MHAFNTKLQNVASENCVFLAIVMFTDPSTQKHCIILTAVKCGKGSRTLVMQRAGKTLV